LPFAARIAPTANNALKQAQSMPTGDHVTSPAQILRQILLHLGRGLLRHGVQVVAVLDRSMVDLALMAKLVAAIPPAARLILLGDKDQLASVEAGAVLTDLCNSGAQLKFSKEFAGQ
jgi:exodeoxyribonuclease V alpha subunit